MKIVLIISIIIVLIVLLLSVMTTSKAYQYKHTVDPIKKDPESSSEKETNKDHT
ncbi:YtzI protein [Bacillus weihaiensis]|uniref:YtzI protein n=1 Tax=Bacillus weihaiensis TaxID=1547283 RepID=UPI00093529F8|nr:YtzI protein [Bacillus weihaiensis]